MLGTMRFKTQLYALAGLLLAIMVITHVVGLVWVRGVGEDAGRGGAVVAESLLDVLTSIRSDQQDQIVQFERALRQGKGGTAKAKEGAQRSEEEGLRLPSMKVGAAAEKGISKGEEAKRGGEPREPPAAEGSQQTEVEFKLLSHRVEEGLSKAQGLLQDVGGRTGRDAPEWQVVQDRWKVIAKEMVEFNRLGGYLFELLRAGRSADAVDLAEKLAQKNRGIRQAQAQVLEELRGQVQSALSAGSGGARSATPWVWSVPLLALLLGLGGAAFMIRAIQKNLGCDPHEVRQMLESLAASNFQMDRSYHHKTMISEAVRKLAEGLGALFRGILQDAKQMQQAATELHSAVGEIASGAEQLNKQATESAGAVTEMSNSLDTVLDTTKRMSSKMKSVSISAEQISANMNTISSAAEEANVNLGSVAQSIERANRNMEHVRDASQRTGESVNTVATSVEQLTATIGEVRSRCEIASRGADEAKQNAQETFSVVQKLGVFAQEIGKVVAVISNIAEQTNILALNASIEAAGAGEAGKGFAVVANEVKELARQTSEATRMISEKIGQIQETTHAAGTASQQVGEIIKRLSTANSEILQAVDEQNQTVSSISNSMGNVSSETSAVTQRVIDASSEIGEVSRNIQEISLGIDEVTRNVVEASAGVDGMTQSIVDASSVSSEISQHLSETARVVTVVAKGIVEVKWSSDQIEKASMAVTEHVQAITTGASKLDNTLSHQRY